MTSGVSLSTERSTATPRIGAGDHALQAGPMRASVRAHAGGRIASLWREEPDGSRTDVLVPMQDLPFDPDQWQKAAIREHQLHRIYTQWPRAAEQ